MNVVNASDIQIRESRYRIICLITAWAGIILHFFWVFLFAYLEFSELSIINVYSTFVFLFIFYLTKKKMFFTSIALAVIEVIIHQTFAVCYLGWNSGFQYFLFPVLALPFLLSMQKQYAKILLCSLTILTYGTLLALFRDQKAIYDIPELGVTIFHHGNFSFSMILIALFCHYFNHSVNLAEIALEKEKQRSEKLLLNILPESIAQRLKEKDEIIADGHKEVSVLFLDIVGYTKISASKTPAELVRILNDIFSKFDSLTEHYGLEKIKTIGDCYMVAAGIPSVKLDGVKSILLFAKDSLEFLNVYNSKNTTDLKIRIGVHTGEVVAGVIGSSKFAYDLWGDAVNLASRMESHGIVGRIQVSQDTYEKAKNDFEFEPRGEIEVKGKGLVKSYLLSI